MRICPRCLKSLYKNVTDHDCDPTPEWKALEQKAGSPVTEKEKTSFAQTRMTINKHKALVITARSALQSVVDSGALQFLPEEVQETIWRTCDTIDKEYPDDKSPPVSIDYQIAYADGYIDALNKRPLDTSQVMSAELQGFLVGYLDGMNKNSPKFQL